MNPSSKVFDYLKSKDIGYIVVGENETIVNGIDKVYDLYKEISCIEYTKYTKKELIYHTLNNILEKNFELSDTILDFFNSINN